jgi:peptide/nickel transport system substrate-binding protein
MAASDRQSGLGEISHCEKILPNADWNARIGRGECARIVCEFEGHALTQAHTGPILWYNRIVPTTANVKGWNMTPSHYIGQDLADVCIDR